MSRAALSAIVLLAAAPALAQDAACAGQGDGGQWIGGSEAGSDIATATSHKEQMALVLSGNSHVSLFTLSAPADVRIEAAGRGNGDPTMDLYGPDGTLILSDDDSGGNGAARAEPSLDPGTYCVNLQSYDNSPMTAFVRIGLTSHEALTAGMDEASDSDDDTTETAGDSGGEGSCETALALGPLSGSLTNISSAGSAPYIAFTLSAPTAISITAENEEADPTIVLYDGSGEYISENDDFDGLNSRIDETDPLPAGDYCVEVGALSDSGVPITVSITEYDPEAALAGLYKRGEAAPPLNGPVPIQDLGALTNRQRIDAQVGGDAVWYAITMPESGLLLIEAIAAGEGGDPWLALFDDFGRQLALNDDSGEGLDSLVTARVNAGTYLVAVKQVADAQGFVRVIFERFIPAP